jgi:nucleotide-binding universal stress UspA family protein
MEAAAERAAAMFAEECGLEPADMTVVQGDAGMVLCDLAEDANLLVVGTRSRGPLRTNLLGSVGRHCADHAPVPLVVVPAERETVGSDRIIVGVDGSDNAHEALRWAAAHAGDLPLTAVASWQTPVDGPVMFGGGRFDLKAFRNQAARIVDEAVEKVTADLGLDPGRIERSIVEGDARWTLQKEQADAGLLVLGRRGRGGLAHLVLGSTTTALIRKPDCPVAVIPPEQPHD